LIARMTEPPPVLIFDLDGTILRVNSFPRWVLFLIAGFVPGLGMRRRLTLSLRAQALLCGRKFGGLTHDELRRGLRRAWHAATQFQADTMAHRFQLALLRHVRPGLRPLLKMVEAECVDAVLATAAAAEYASEFGRQLGFRHVLAGSSGRAGAGTISTGQRKRDQVRKFLAARGWQERTLVLLTDHIDDLPLMRECGLVCWFGPERGLAEARAAAGARFIFCRPLDGEDIIAALRAHGVPLGVRNASSPPMGAERGGRSASGRMAGAMPRRD